MAGEGNVSMGMTADAGDVLRQLDKIIQKQNKLSGGFQKTKQHSDGFTGSLNRGLSGSSAQIMSMAASFVSVGAAIALARSAWQGWQKEIAEGAENIKAFQQQYINLQAIGKNYDDPKMREKVLKESVRISTMPKETAASAYGWTSMTGHLAGDPEKRARLWTALTKMQKTMDVPAKDLVPIFGKSSSFFPKASAREISNNAQLLIEMGAITAPADLASEAPKIYSAGQMGKMSFANTNALAAYMTMKTGTPALAASGMEQVVRKFMFKDEEENTKSQQLAFGEVDPKLKRQSIFKAAGVVDPDSFMQRWDKVVKAMPKEGYSMPEVKGIVGEKTAKYLYPMFQDPARLSELVELFEKETGPGKDRVGDRLVALDKNDEIFRLVEAGKALGVAKNVASQKDKAGIYWGNARALVESESKNAGETSLIRWLRHAPGNDTWNEMRGLVFGHKETSAGWAWHEIEKMGAQRPGLNSYEDVERKMGIAPGDLPSRLNQAAENIFGASVEMKAAAGALTNSTNRAADANSHVETPALGGG